MQYNTQQSKLIMPEYGRTVQQMVDYAITLPTREKRMQCAESIIEVMANMQPSLRSQPDYRHKLWDHLAYISDYKLDIDYPVQITRLDDSAVAPQPIPYPKKSIRNRHYGFVLEQFLEHLSTLPDGEERDTLLSYMANQMKQSLFDWNRDAMDDEKIASDIARYTDGRVSLDLQNFTFNKVSPGRPQLGESKKKKKKK